MNSLEKPILSPEQYAPRPTWMAELPGMVKELPINTIHIPGTHDSGSSQVDFFHPLGPSRWFDVASFAGEIFPCIGGIIKGWTVTQDYRIDRQLEMGIRSLDLRVSYNPKNDKYFITHTFTCVSLDSVIKSIARFLEANTQEVLIIDMKAGWFDREEMTPEHNEKLIEILKNQLGDLLCKVTRDGTFDPSMSISNMAKRGERVVLFFEGPTMKNHDILWDRSKLQVPWSDTSDLEAKMQDLDLEVKELTWSPTSINGLLFTLTPQKPDVVDDIWNRIFSPCSYEPKSVRTFATEIHSKTEAFMEENRSLLKKNISLMITDFPSEKFVREVISLNYEQ